MPETGPAPIRNGRQGVRAAAWLAGSLRLAGSLMALASLAVLLPDEWMARTHRWLGMGRLPQEPIVGYLARSASALYAIHGGLYLVVARDVLRHRAVVRYLAFAAVSFGVAMVAIDSSAGMPAYWTLLEGPPVIAFGSLLWALVRRLPPSADPGS